MYPEPSPNKDWLTWVFIALGLLAILAITNTGFPFIKLFKILLYEIF